MSSTLDLITRYFWSVGITANLANYNMHNKSIEFHLKQDTTGKTIVFLCTGHKKLMHNKKIYAQYMHCNFLILGYLAFNNTTIFQTSGRKISKYIFKYLFY